MKSSSFVKVPLEQVNTRWFVFVKVPVPHIPVCLQEFSCYLDEHFQVSPHSLYVLQIRRNRKLSLKVQILPTVRCSIKLLLQDFLCSAWVNCSCLTQDNYFRKYWLLLSLKEICKYIPNGSWHTSLKWRKNYMPRAGFEPASPLFWSGYFRVT